MDQTSGSFLCHRCWTRTPLNLSAACLRCRLSIPDITASIPKHVDLTYCTHCGAYRHPPGWVPTKLQPNELLSFLVKNLSGLDGACLVDSEFDWAPDLPPRAVRVRFTFRKESLEGLTTKACTVWYDLHESPCWPCVLAQLDQNTLSAVAHVFSQSPKTLLSDNDFVLVRLGDRVYFFCEKLANAHDLVAHQSWSSLVQVVRDELDKFRDKTNEMPLCKYVASVETIRIRVGDLVCLPSWASGRLENFGPFVICDHVGGCSIAFLNPLDSRREILDMNEFWRFPFLALLSREDLVEYVVVEVEDVFLDSQSRRLVGEVRVVPAFGNEEEEASFDVRTHLGAELDEGDCVLGYDLVGSGIFDMYKDVDVPYIVLVEKSGWVEEDSEDEDDI